MSKYLTTREELLENAGRRVSYSYYLTSDYLIYPYFEKIKLREEGRCLELMKAKTGID